MTEVRITNVPERGRYEADIDGTIVGTADYVVVNGVIAFTHAEVKPEYGHRGIASEMARVSLDDARREGHRQVRAVCPFYQWYVEQHPEYADLVA